MINMKKKLLLLLSLFIICVANAQVLQNEHFKFMGIPMDCDAETFAKKLEKEKGLERYQNHSDRKILTGTFSGYNDCVIIVSGEGNRNVHSVGVILPHGESWSLVKSQYNTLKTRLMTKYGDPSNCIEEFRQYEPSLDNLRFDDVKNGNAIFHTEFMTSDGGKIDLSINSVEFGSGYIQLIYIDIENAKIENDNLLDDL